jgi:hypothetical protein
MLKKKWQFHILIPWEKNGNSTFSLKSGMELTRQDTMRFHPIFSSFGQKKGTNTVEQLFYFHHSKKKRLKL